MILIDICSLNKVSHKFDVLSTFIFTATSNIDLKAILIDLTSMD